MPTHISQFTPSCHIVFRALIEDGEDLVANLLSELTGGLVNISSGAAPKFDLGPLGGDGSEIEGILNDFGIDFEGFIEDFKADYTAFKDNLDNHTTAELKGIIDLKPKSLAKFGSLLQIGSKKPSLMLSASLKLKLWSKLVATFPSFHHNGVPVPGLPLGQNFSVTYPTPGDFPVRNFLPALAVAFGRAPSFSDVRAQKFTLDQLFTPTFGPELSNSLLQRIKGVQSFQLDFDRFDAFDPISGLPMVSSTKEIFDVNAYLPGESHLF